VNEYADLLFLLNFFADYVLLLLTARLRVLQSNVTKLTIAAFLGSVYVIVQLMFPSWTFLTAGFVKMIVGLLMVRVAFGYHGMQHFVRNISIFYAICFMIAGFMFAAVSVFKLTDFGWIQFVILFSIGAVLVLLIERSYRRKHQVQSGVFPVSIVIDDITIQCRGLVDTGNHLADPISRKPVSVTQWDVWTDVLPEEILIALRNGDSQLLISTLDVQPFRWHHRLSLIPYRTVGSNGHSLMATLRVDRVMLDCGDKVKIMERALIGINPATLCHDNRYNAIIHPAFLF